jgi:hypothetical protein
MRSYLFCLLLFPLLVKGQGLFLGASVGQKGLTGFNAGYRFSGLLEIGALYNPLMKSSSNGGYAGGLLKLPLLYRPFVETYTSSFVIGLNMTGNAGMVLYPTPDAAGLASVVSYAKNDFGRSLSLGLELMWFAGGICISLPVDFGYGKMHFNQTFDKSDPNTFQLGSNLFMMAGIRIFFSKDHCRNYIEDLRGGN